MNIHRITVASLCFWLIAGYLAAQSTRAGTAPAPSSVSASPAPGIGLFVSRKNPQSQAQGEKARYAAQDQTGIDPAPPTSPFAEAAKKQRGEPSIVALTRTHSTRIALLPDTEIVRRGNFVIAATLDGFLCHGTKVPRSVSCHRALKVTETEESIMYIGRGHQAEDLPRGADPSRTAAGNGTQNPLLGR
jgi:hypothetical protein